MTPKELLEITILVIGGGGGAAAGGFAFAMWQYSSKLEKLQIQVEKSSFTEGRKLRQNIDHLLTEFGTLKCDVRDIKAVLIRQGVIHERAGFPEENIPKRTGWTIEDA
ncbi:MULTISPECIES: hypothetical protein [unclassified Microcoleus]|uniref:hypothetical protein n=1 Tax=unclassified Microcoleus TaxID=2642155 RepID=UPI002FD6F9DA